MIKSRESVAALGLDLFGDQVNLANGALSFSATEGQVPGNSKLQVGIGRTYVAGNRKGVAVLSTGGTMDLPFGDWDLVVPRLSGVFAPNWPNARCSAITGQGSGYSGAAIQQA